MLLFVDSANLDEIRQAVQLGVISGVTTNPTLLAKQGTKDTESVIREICEMVPNGPVSMEVVGPSAKGMIEEGMRYAQWGENVMIKVPFSPEGTEAVHAFSQEGIQTNVTLVFSVNQVLLAAAAGATVISSFVGRLDDVGHDGIQVIEEAVELMDTHCLESQILAASIRHPLHATQAALAGAHIATIPYKVIQQMYAHPLTEKGITAFNADWAKLTAS